MNLTPHFKMSEFTNSDTARMLRVDNTPTGVHLGNVQHTARMMELVRSLLDDNPIIISSGYRNPVVNRAVGGVPNSSHAQGLAVDFTCPKFGAVIDVAKAIAASALPFDQLIFEQGNSQWVHLGFGPRMRREVLSWSPSRGYAIGIREM